MRKDANYKFDTSILISSLFFRSLHYDAQYYSSKQGQKQQLSIRKISTQKLLLTHQISETMRSEKINPKNNMRQHNLAQKHNINRE